MRHEHGRPTELTRRYGPGGVLLGLCVALSLGVLFQWLCIDGRVCKAGAQVWPWSLSGMQGMGSAAPHGLLAVRPWLFVATITFHAPQSPYFWRCTATRGAVQLPSYAF